MNRGILVSLNISLATLNITSCSACSGNLMAIFTIHPLKVLMRVSYGIMTVSTGSTLASYPGTLISIGVIQRSSRSYIWRNFLSSYIPTTLNLYPEIHILSPTLRSSCSANFLLTSTTGLSAISLVNHIL